MLSASLNMAFSAGKIRGGTNINMVVALRSMCVCLSVRIQMCGSVYLNGLSIS